MPPRKSSTPPTPPPAEPLPRLERSPGLIARTEQALRTAIAGGRFPDGHLPTEVELAAQLGVSRETVRLAAGTLMREGLLVKIRRRGTFLRPTATQEPIVESGCLGYLQTDYPTPEGGDEAATSVTSGLMLQGALAEAGRAGHQLLVQHASDARLPEVARELCRGGRLRGVVFASCGHEKVLRSTLGFGIPIVLLDHDLNLPGIHTVRDDSFEGAHLAVRHLAGLGHKSIALIHWREADLNPWRLDGYRQGMRSAGLAVRRKWEIAVPLTATGAAQAVERFLALTPRPTALYCFNNTLAKLVMEELVRRAVRVPEVVSVMGAGGEDVPGLTCTLIDWQEMGRAAVRMLLSNATGSVKPERLLLPHVLRTGQTARAIHQ